MPPNVHYLELFYYVAKHGGIMNAVRRMPYGIQQPAVSGQILKLEESLGVRLFHRRPFQLTPEGERLFAYCEPFFGRLEDLGDELRGSGSMRLRLASSESVLRDHLPPLLASFQQQHPLARITLVEANQHQAEQALLRNELDLALTEIGSKPCDGIHYEPLLEVKPILLLQADKNGVKTLKDFFEQPKLPPLIAFAPSETLTKLFSDELARQGLVWPVSLEVSSLELIQTYVHHGFGVGLSVEIPGRIFPKTIRAIPLNDFPGLKIGAFWRGKPPELQAAFLERVRAEAQRMKQA